MMRLPVAAADHGMCGKCQSKAIALQVKRAVSGKAGLEQFWDGTLHHRSDLPYAEDLHDLQDVFTPFRNKASTCLADPISPATMLGAINIFILLQQIGALPMCASVKSLAIVDILLLQASNGGMLCRLKADVSPGSW